MHLDGKKILVLGVASDRSIAAAIAKLAKQEGATVAITYQNERIRSHVEVIAKQYKVDFVLPCDVTSDESVAGLADFVRKEWGALDGLVHSLAFAPQEALSGGYLESISRDAFIKSHEISSYSLGQLCLALKEPLCEAHGKVVTMSFIGSQRVFPNYNVMGLAKASLEANVRYLAHSLGTYQVNVNAISAGPVKTLAAAGISGFRQMLKAHESISALKRNVTAEEVAKTAVFLLSDYASGITGEVLYVDAGFQSAGFAIA